MCHMGLTQSLVLLQGKVHLPGLQMMLRSGL
jgi:hypothetical protein